MPPTSAQCHKHRLRTIRPYDYQDAATFDATWRALLRVNVSVEVVV